MHLVAASNQNLSKMTSNLALCLRRNRTIIDQNDASEGVLAYLCMSIHGGLNSIDNSIAPPSPPHPTPGFGGFASKRVDFPCGDIT